MEYYSKKTGLEISGHNLRHTMATQMLNADVELSTIEDLLGHNWITTTQKYCAVFNLKVQRDDFKAMDIVMPRSSPIPLNGYRSVTARQKAPNPI